MRRKKGLKLVLGRSGGNAHQRRMRHRHFVRQENLEAERERLEKARQAKIMISGVLVDPGAEDGEEPDRRQQEKELLLKALPKRGIFSRMINGLISLVVT
jgi:hypothetical protein